MDECGEHGYRHEYDSLRLGKSPFFPSILTYVKSTNVYVKLSDDSCWPLIGVVPPSQTNLVYSIVRYKIMEAYFTPPNISCSTCGLVKLACC